MVKLRTSAKHKKKNIKKYTRRNKRNKNKKTMNQKRYKRKRYSKKMIGGAVCLSNGECLKLVGSVKGTGNIPQDVAMGVSQSPVTETVQQELPKKTGSSLLNRFGYEPTKSKFRDGDGTNHLYERPWTEVLLGLKKIESPPIGTPSSVVTTTETQPESVTEIVQPSADTIETQPESVTEIQPSEEKEEQGIKPDNNMTNEQQFQQQVDGSLPAVAEKTLDQTSLGNGNISVQPPLPPTKNEEELANDESRISNINTRSKSKDDMLTGKNITGKNKLKKATSLLRTLSLNDMRQESETQENPNIVTKNTWLTERNNESDVGEKNSEIIEEKEQQIEDTVENDENNGEFTPGPEYESVEEVENEYDNSDRYNRFASIRGGKTRTRRSRKMKIKKRKSRPSRKIRKNKKTRK